jgi:two-component system, NarL family, response regulator DesR
MNASEPVAIFIWDRHLAVRQGLLTILAANESVKVMGESGGDDELIDAIKETDPSVLVLGFATLDAQELSLLANLRNQFPTLGVVVYADVATVEQHTNLYQAGARAVVAKSGTEDELVSAILEVANGGWQFPVGVSDQIAIYYLSRQFARDPRECLNKQQMDVFISLVNNEPYKDIALKLHLSHSRIKNVALTLRKILNADRTEFRRIAILYNLI